MADEGTRFHNHNREEQKKMNCRAFVIEWPRNWTLWSLFLTTLLRVSRSSSFYSSEVWSRIFHSFHVERSEVFLLFSNLSMHASLLLDLEISHIPTLHQTDPNLVSNANDMCEEDKASSFLFEASFSRKNESRCVSCRFFVWFEFKNRETTP